MQCSKLGTVRDTNKAQQDILQQKEYERGTSSVKNGV